MNAVHIQVGERVQFNGGLLRDYGTVTVVHNVEGKLSYFVKWDNRTGGWHRGRMLIVEVGNRRCIGRATSETRHA
jgi:hypothetical protein